MNKKIFTLRELEDLSAGEIIDKIKYENYSLLSTLHAEKLRKEMVPVGKICNAAVNFFLGTTGPRKNQAEHAQNARQKLVKMLSKITPYEFQNLPETRSRGLVIGFNHPSLGEIPRLLAMEMQVMGGKTMLFPVNLPWYEALASDYDKIKQLGIIIVPIITPATWDKLKLEKGTELYEVANRLKKEFRDRYTDESHEVLKNGGVIFVAPSATRQATVFKTREIHDGKDDPIPTMSLLALRLYRDKAMQCDFWPVAVLPPENYQRGLNFWKKYQFMPGQPMTAEYIREKWFSGKKPPERLEGFDYEFHRRIAEQLPPEFVVPA